MKKWCIMLLCYGLISLGVQANDLSTFFDKADKFFDQSVKKHLVNYAEHKENPQQLNELIQIMENIKLEGASKKEKQAFWINAYNLTVIHTLVQHYPTPANEIEGFFDQKKHSIAGSSLTLDELVKKKLKEPYYNPRLLFALCKGAKGSPPIENHAYRPGQLEVQLNKHLRTTINQENYIKIHESSEKIMIPVTFYHYKDELQEVEKNYISFINHFLRHQSIPSNYEVKFYPFDWSLNKRE